MMLALRLRLRLRLLLALVAAGDPVTDPIFRVAVEHWVIDATPAGMRGLATVADGVVCDLIAMLGCRDPECGHACRARAESELRHLGDEVLGPLVWATRHRDPEVRQRAERLLGALVYCRRCGGTGLGEYAYTETRAGVPRVVFWLCKECGGDGLRR